LNQQKVVERQQLMVMIPVPQEPGLTGLPMTAGPYPARVVGPDVINVDGGSMAPKNMPQQIQLAQQMQNDLGQDQHVDQRALLRRRLELYGFQNPEAYMTPDTTPLDPQVLDRVKQARPDVASVIDAAVAASQRENPIGGRSPVPDPQQGPQNGNQPDQQPAGAPS
jgi:hypothetical protein